MKFTIVFPSHEADEMSVGGIFVPCFVWRIRKKNHVPHPDYPHYREGDFLYLLKKLQVTTEKKIGHRHVVIVVHSNGHGREADLNLMCKDIETTGYTYKKVKIA